VISGYVISKSLTENDSPSFLRFALDFYRRRVLRIVPALAFFLVTTSVLAVLLVPKAWLSQPNDETALYAFFGLSNLYLVGAADGYFSTRIPFNPFVHTWSLGSRSSSICSFRLSATSDQVSTILDFYGRCRSWTVASSFSSLCVASYETTTAHDRAFYLLPSRFWELGAGAVLYQLTCNQQWYVVVAWRRHALVAGAALVTIAFFLTDERAFLSLGPAPVVGSA
jgi:peptidoglycan/LPS O-acetylase OafA/YrhL